MRRQFHLTERTSLFLGAEYFNLFNHPMFAADNFNHALGYPAFGQITETLNEDLGLLNPLYQIGGPRSGAAHHQIVVLVLVFTGEHGRHFFATDPLLEGLT